VSARAVQFTQETVNASNVGNLPAPPDFLDQSAEMRPEESSGARKVSEAQRDQAAAQGQRFENNQEQTEYYRQGSLGKAATTEPLSPDLDRILKRIHNLELLAVRGGDPNSTFRPRLESSSENPQVDALQRRQALVLNQHGCNAAHLPDLELAVQRIQIIEADFDLLHSKYNTSKAVAPSPKLWVREEVNGRAMSLSKDLVAEIEQEILAELLNKELLFS
jgi:hypothetical protein